MNITGPASASALQFAFRAPLPSTVGFVLLLGDSPLTDTRVLDGGRRLVVALPPTSRLPAGRYPYTLVTRAGTVVLRGTYTRS